MLGDRLDDARPERRTAFDALRLEDGDACLEVRRSDVDDEPTGEARDEALVPTGRDVVN